MKRKFIHVALCMLIIYVFQPSSCTEATGCKNQFICIFEEEGNFEKGDWIIDKKVTKGNFDETYKVRWAQNKYKGIYSAVRNDEDLWDETVEEGAWCCAAEEHGGLFRNEHSEGWAEIKRSFRLNDWMEDSVDYPYYKLAFASVGFDYKIHNWSLDHEKSWVCLRVYLSVKDGDDFLVGSLCWGKKFESMSAQGKKDNVRWENMEDGRSVCNFLTENSFNEIFIKFRLEVSLYGRMYGIRRVLVQDRLMFWLDDVKICLLYTYNDTPDSLFQFSFDSTVGTSICNSPNKIPEKNSIYYYKDRIMEGDYVLQDLRKSTIVKSISWAIPYQ